MLTPQTCVWSHSRRQDVPYLYLRARHSKLACDQVGFFSPITRKVSEQFCILCCGILLCSCNVDPAKSMFLAVSEFVNQKWHLGTKQELPITFRDADNDECIFNEANFQDSLTCTSEEKIWFTVHLPWADRFKLRPWRPSEPTWKLLYMFLSRFAELMNACPERIMRFIQVFFQGHNSVSNGNGHPRACVSCMKYITRTSFLVFVFAENRIDCNIEGDPKFETKEGIHVSVLPTISYQVSFTDVLSVHH